jgi:hypothetical protein
MRHIFPRALLAASVVAVAASVAGCAGVPLATVAQLAMKGQGYLADADPAQVRIALDVDARIKAAAIKPPSLNLVLKPEGADAGATFTRDIALVPDATDSTRLALPAAGAGRGWLVYGFDAAGARQMAELQQRLREMRSAKQKGSLAISVKVDGVEEAFPQFAATELATWMRVAAADGFFKLWSGRIADASKKA